MARVAMLGTGLIGMLYTMTLPGRRSRDDVTVVYSRTEERAAGFAQQWGIPRHTTSMVEAVNDPEATVIVVGLPNDQHEEAVRLAAEARRMLDTVEQAGVFHGYLEDLVYTPKTLRALQSTRKGALGKVL